MKKQLIYLSLLSFLMAACSQTEKDEITNGNRAVSFDSNIGSATRVTEIGFETGDAISVYAFQEGYNFSSGSFYAMNTKYVYQNGFVAAVTPIFYPEDGTPLSFYAVYPYNTLGNGGVFQVEENQEEENNYTMSDLMTAVVPPTIEERPTLTFRHGLASVQVNITNEYEGFNIDYAQLCGFIYEAEINLSENKFKAVTGGTVKDITMKSIDNDSFKAIFPPQTKEMNDDIIRITGTGTSGQTVLTGKLNKRTRYDSGVRHTYNLRITSNGKLLNEGEEESFIMDGVIEPWNEPSDIEAIIPPAILDSIEKYMPVYKGVNPPNVEGCYLIEPDEAVYCQDYGNGGYEPGTICLSEIIRFFNQNNKTLTIDFEGKTISDISYSEGKGSFISGEGNDFTVYFDTEGQNRGIYTRMADIYSGTLSASGIVDLYHGFVMVEKGDDPEHLLMDEGVFRLFKDGDGTAYHYEWNNTPETRFLNELPSSVMNSNYWNNMKHLNK